MVKINIKSGVIFRIIGPEFCILARIVYRVLQKYNVVPTVTSANDGKHHPNSWHYKDGGWDWRIWGVDDPKTSIDEVREAADEIRREAQAIDYHYDVIYGDPEHLDHIHTEFNLDKRQ